MANVVSRLSPQGFQACLLSWTRAVAQVAGDQGDELQEVRDPKRRPAPRQDLEGTA